MRPIGDKLVIATHNPGKLREIAALVEPLGIACVGAEELGLPEPEEIGNSFADNADLKAREAADLSGFPALADDSGLCVDALNGMPGVLSARWAGSAKDDTANNRLLLEQLADVPDERRGAHFTCAVAFAYPVGAGGVAEHVVHGEMPGRVIRETRGSGGFGYDVLFVADENAADRGGDGRTSAELSVEEKDAISHRGKAIRAIAPLVADVLTGL
jgi:XTP/dITP diphosphohydrolase